MSECFCFEAIFFAGRRNKFINEYNVFVHIISVDNNINSLVFSFEHLDELEFHSRMNNARQAKQGLHIVHVIM